MDYEHKLTAWHGNNHCLGIYCCDIGTWLTSNAICCIEFDHDGRYHCSCLKGQCVGGIEDDSGVIPGWICLGDLVLNDDV